MFTLSERSGGFASPSSSGNCRKKFRGTGIRTSNRDVTTLVNRSFVSGAGNFVSL